MDSYTRATKAWLDARYRNSFDETTPNLYYAHEPIYGIGSEHCERQHARRIVRLFQLLLRVRAVGGRTLLDVGGSEGYFALLCRELFGMTVVSVDLSEEACRRAAEIFAVPGAAVDAAALPFAADSFDVVTCAEVVEHLADPVPAILEMQRVARGTLVLGTEEWHADAADRDRALAERRATPHGERSVFADADLRPLFAPYETSFERQVVPDLSRVGDDRNVDRAALGQLLLDLANGRTAGTGTMGIVLTIAKSRSAGPTPRRPDDTAIVELLLGRACPLHLIGAPTPTVPWPAAITPRCIACGAVPAATDHGFACPCGERYPRRRGALVFLRDNAPFAQRVDAMLAERGGAAYGDQRGELVDLAAKLELPFQPRTAWSFDDRDEVAPWRCSPSCAPLGHGRFRVGSDDPHLVLDVVGCAPEAAQIATVEMSVRVDDPTAEFDIAEMYWLVDEQLGFAPHCSAGVVVVPDGRMRSYRFEAPGSLRGDVLVSLRLDPVMFRSADVHLRSVRLDRRADIERQLHQAT